MITKSELEKMFSPLPARTRKRCLDRVLARMEIEKEDKAILLYTLRMLFHDFIKPIDMADAISKFVSPREKLGIKSIAIDSLELSLTQKKLESYGRIRRHFFKLLDELKFKDEFEDFLETNYNFFKGEE